MRHAVLNDWQARLSSAFFNDERLCLTNIKACYELFKLGVRRKLEPADHVFLTNAAKLREIIENIDIKN